MAASSGFALGFLRRLLCAHATADNNSARRDDAPQPEGQSPCLVARLMGLDAMPTPQEAPPLRRTRSASSAGELGDAAASLKGKTAYLRAENDMFLLLSFSPEDRDTANNSKADDEERRRGDRAGGARKQRRPHRRKLQFGGGDDDEADSSSSARRDCTAQQGSSPVSVLDAHEESSTTTSSCSGDVEPCSATSVRADEEAHFALEQQSSTTKLHTGIVKLDDMSPATTSTVLASTSTCSDRDKRNRRMVNKSYVNAPDVTGIWQPICRLIDEDLRNMEWLARDGANLVAEMDSEILDQLICEAAVELVQLSSDAYPFRYVQKYSGKPSDQRYPSPRT